MEEKRSLTDRLWDSVPSLQMPTLGKTVDIPVYVIHNSKDPEDYFFIFDFEQFVEMSEGGMFVRPRLKVWAGRRDFARPRFARQFRESFAREFDAARIALAETKKSKGWGWFSLGLGVEAVAQNYGNVVANLVLLVAMSATKRVLSVFSWPKLFRGKSDAAKLEESIQETQGKVDTALSGMTIVLHKELWTHAYRGTTPGSMTGMDKDAWPLSDFVKAHLGDEASTSRW